MRKLKVSKWEFTRECSKVVAEIDYERQSYSVYPGAGDEATFRFTSQRLPNSIACRIASLIAEACAFCEQELKDKDWSVKPAHSLQHTLDIVEQSGAPMTKVEAKPVTACAKCGKQAPTDLHALSTWCSYRGVPKALCPECLLKKQPAEETVVARFNCLKCGKAVPANKDALDQWSRVADSLALICPECSDKINKRAEQFSSALENSK